MIRHRCVFVFNNFNGGDKQRWCHAVYKKKSYTNTRLTTYLTGNLNTNQLYETTSGPILFPLHA